MNKTISIIFTSVMISSLSGCATIMSGSHQKVHVQAIRASDHQIIQGATCSLSDPAGGTYLTHANPGTANVPRHSGGLSVACVAKGYYQQSVATGSSFNAWTLGNVIFWPGAIVDIADGAAEKYPSYITVEMTQHPVKSKKSFKISEHEE